jgi:hypothetical protein
MTTSRTYLWQDPLGPLQVAIATRRTPELSAVVVILKAIATQPDRQYVLVYR